MSDHLQDPYYTYLTLCQLLNMPTQGLFILGDQKPTANRWHAEAMFATPLIFLRRRALVRVR